MFNNVRSAPEYEALAAFTESSFILKRIFFISERESLAVSKRLKPPMIFLCKVSRAFT